MGDLREEGLWWTYYLLVLTVLVVASVPAMGASTGTTGASFLKVAVGPRAAAMGTAYVAVAEEPYAMYYNPASIASTERWQLSAMHQDQFAQVNFDYVGLAAPAIRGRSSWGISMVRLASDDFFRTELDDGSKFTNEDLALTGTYAHRIFKPLSVGGSFKLIRQTLANITASGWAVDLGLHLKVNTRLSMGASISNIGPPITFISIGDPLPTTFRVGGAFKLLPRGNLLATMDYWKPRDDAAAIGIGMEYRPNRFFAFRGGYQIGTDFSGFDASAYGLTFNFENFGIEYAFVPREKLGDVHRAGLNVTFGGQKPQVVASRPERSSRRKKVSAGESEPKRQATQAKKEVSSEPSSYYELPVKKEEPVQSAASAPSVAPAALPPSGRSAAPSTSVSTTALPPSGRSQAQAGPAPEKSAEASQSISEQMALRQKPAPEWIPEKETLPVLEQPLPSSSMIQPAFTPLRPAVSNAPEDKTEITQEKISLAATLMKQQRFEEAIVIIRSGINEDPGSVPLWYLLSESYYKTGEYDRAMEAVSKALAILHGEKSPVRP